MEVGYVRVSTVDQHTGRQLQGVTVEKVFEDKVSGKDANRPALQQCLEFLREGDTLHVHSIDRMARNLKDLLDILGLLARKNVTVHFHHENLVFSGEGLPTQKLHLQIMGAVAEFERALIKERQREGIELAKKKGVYKKKRGRSLPDEKIAEILTEARDSGNISATARKYRLTRMTLHRWIKEYQQPSS